MLTKILMLNNTMLMVVLPIQDARLQWLSWIQHSLQKIKAGKLSLSTTCSRHLSLVIFRSKKIKWLQFYTFRASKPAAVLNRGVASPRANRRLMRGLSKSEEDLTHDRPNKKFSASGTNIPFINLDFDSKGKSFYLLNITYNINVISKWNL